MRKLWLSIFVISMIAYSCEEKDCCADGSELSGTWILFEKGWSPGAGYFITPVPEKPEQLIAFSAAFTMSTNIEGLQDYKFYRILDDNNSDDKILAMFQTNPDDPIDQASLKHSYTIKTEGGDLKLYYRYCIEGCHMGLKRKSLTSSQK